MKRCGSDWGVKCEGGAGDFSGELEQGGVRDVPKDGAKNTSCKGNYLGFFLVALNTLLSIKTK